MKQNYWEAEDKKYIWHPAMQMKDNEVFPPVVIEPCERILPVRDGREGISGYYFIVVVQSPWALQ